MAKEDKNENLWLEDALYGKISESAEKIAVPDPLLPEQIAEKLKQRKKEKKMHMLQKATGIAAVFVLAAALGTAGYYGFRRNDSQKSGKQPEQLAAAEGESSTEYVPVREKKEYAGDLYHRADDYEEVYQAVKRTQSYDWDTGEWFVGAMSGVWNGALDTNKSDSIVGIPEDGSAAADGTENFSYSETNVQVEGIDESDIIKNDGNYLYIASDVEVRLIDIRSEEMKQAGEIHPDHETSGGSAQIGEMYIEEMYVDKDRLYLIVSWMDTTLEESENPESSFNAAYRMDSSAFIELMTYDIRDRAEPKLIGSVKQDGYYYTSRKAGDIIYLFSSEFLGNVEEKEPEELIPYVDGARVDAGCIYVPEKGNSEMILSSVDVRKPQKTIDQMVILNDSAEIYMGSEAIYFYHYEYQSGKGREFTQIAKFSYKDGIMDAVSAASVKGTVQDTFAVSESNGIFRILTTDWSAEEQTNQLYLFDEDMKITGSISDIARGESVYAARYIGDMAYFVTYRNTDPLFAVDLSDPENPVLLGSLEISGFSDYLHPYGENLLLGIGYETDPDTGRNEGIKLCMFDISEGADLKVIDTEVLKEPDYIPGADFYKCILADPKKNLIGFLTEDYDRSDSASYQVFQWDGEDFHEVLSQEIADPVSELWVRGAYAGDSFYIVTDFGITSYDMENGFAETGHLDF